MILVVEGKNNRIRADRLPRCLLGKEVSQSYCRDRAEILFKYFFTIFS
jgi:hypothetical protein